MDLFLRHIQGLSDAAVILLVRDYLAGHTTTELVALTLNLASRLEAFLIAEEAETALARAVADWSGQ